MNIAKIAQIRIHIQGQPVHGHITAAPHSDGTNLTCCRLVAIQPHTCSLFDPSRNNTIRSTDSYHGLFQQPDVRPYIQSKLLHIQNRITDLLPRPVKSNITTPVDMIQRGSYPVQLLFTQQHILFLSTTPQSIYRRMFAKHNMIHILSSCQLGLHQFVKILLLPLPCFGIRNQFPVYRFYFHGSKNKKFFFKSERIRIIYNPINDKSQNVLFAIPSSDTCTARERRKQYSRALHSQSVGFASNIRRDYL